MNTLDVTAHPSVGVAPPKFSVRPMVTVFLKDLEHDYYEIGRRLYTLTCSVRPGTTVRLVVGKVKPPFDNFPELLSWVRFDLNYVIDATVATTADAWVASLHRSYAKAVTS